MEFETITVPLPPGSGLEGLRVLHLSDIHARGPGSAAVRAVRDLSGVGCDIVCLTGDLVERPPGMDPLGRALAGLSPRLGTFACPGNHDRELPPGVLEEGFERWGVELLVNRSLVLEHAGMEFNLVGTDDPYHYRHDLDAAYAGIEEGLGVLLLTHTPDGVFDLAGRRSDLALSGHTHGGQVCPPLLPVSTNTRNRLPDPQGVMILDGYLCHVSAGLGWSGVPWRWRCPPKSHLLELVEASP